MREKRKLIDNRGGQRQVSTQALPLTFPVRPAIKLFLSYSHKDERFLDELQKHLSTLKHNKLITDWYDHKITPGDRFHQTIHAQIEHADLILLLISADFLHSEYCYSREMRRALERHEAGTARVIPIIIRPTDWNETPFGELSPLPRNGKAVTLWTPRDKAWVNVVHGIRQAIDSIIAARTCHAIVSA